MSSSHVFNTQPSQETGIPRQGRPVSDKNIFTWHHVLVVVILIVPNALKFIAALKNNSIAANVLDLVITLVIGGLGTWILSALKKKQHPKAIWFFETDLRDHLRPRFLRECSPPPGTPSNRRHEREAPIQHDQPIEPVPVSPGITRIDEVPVPSEPSSPLHSSQPLNSLRRRRPIPGPVDLSSRPNGVAQPLPSALATARHIQDISQIQYPEGVEGPRLEPNTNVEKIRYDRDLLLQFMSVCKEKPDNLPDLSDLVQ